MSMIGPSNRGKGAFKGGSKRQENNRIYANPLPIVFSNPPPSNRLQSVLNVLGLSLTKVINPHCEGIFDPTTRSVWVCNSKDTTLLWQRGFFGKGDLSRSEPSWFSRQLNIRQSGGKNLTSEEVREKRRAERKQFKLDRAAAIAAVAEEAEKIFATEGRVIVPALSGPNIPSAATWKPKSTEDENEDRRPLDFVPSPSSNDSTEALDLESLVNVEHLQLTLQEAFFLAWNLDCLTILHPDKNEAMTLKEIWTSFQTAHLPPTLPPSPPWPLQADNPFLINYVVYHHYRSLGWVVKGGIKFCVDYLLYKRGPVFTHAEFALVVCPVYEHEDNQKTSLFDLHNSTPFSWSWLSTINRVNSQVQKTLILVYVTIPDRARLPDRVLDSPACLQYYSVREVTLRRFIPARMRD